MSKSSSTRGQPEHFPLPRAPEGWAELVFIQHNRELCEPLRLRRLQALGGARVGEGPKFKHLATRKGQRICRPVELQRGPGPIPLVVRLK